MPEPARFFDTVCASDQDKLHLHKDCIHVCFDGLAKMKYSIKMGNVVGLARDESYTLRKKATKHGS